MSDTYYRPAWDRTITISDVGMDDNEALKSEQYIKGKNRVLEWGSGGSTLYFPQIVNHYVSIEHDHSWYDKIKLDISDNVEFYHVPTHDIKFDDDLDENAFDILEGNEDWYNRHGSEIRTEDEKTYWNTRGRLDWHCYMDYIRYPLNLTHRNYDIILVDGRARAMCAYVALSLLKVDGYLLFHDFMIREYYHGILNYFELVNYIDTLAILKKR